MSIEEADRGFFSALTRGDAAALQALLVNDFVLIDVMRGAEVSKAELVAAVGGGALRFDAVEVVASRVRRYGAAGVVTGETRMSGRVGEARWSARSRYTHVFIERDGRWQLASAQGTAIAGD
jgi:ketosteroid isomerase-like protein